MIGKTIVVDNVPYIIAEKAESPSPHPVYPGVFSFPDFDARIRYRVSIQGRSFGFIEICGDRSIIFNGDECYRLKMTTKGMPFEIKRYHLCGAERFGLFCVAGSFYRLERMGFDSEKAAREWGKSQGYKVYKRVGYFSY